MEGKYFCNKCGYVENPAILIVKTSTLEVVRSVTPTEGDPLPYPPDETLDEIADGGNYKLTPIEHLWRHDSDDCGAKIYFEPDE